MKDLLDKLSSYNIFNYLLPGVLFAVFVDGMTNYVVLQKDLIVGVFLYYFLGSVVSRVGSLLVEPLLLRFKFVEFASYADFVMSSKVDPKIELLSEQNNMYRTFLGLFFSIVVVVAYEKVSEFLWFLHLIAPYVCVLCFLLLYLFSYRKQTAYIKRRVDLSK